MLFHLFCKPDKDNIALSVAKFYGEIPRVEIEVAAIDVDEVT